MDKTAFVASVGYVGPDRRKRAGHGVRRSTERRGGQIKRAYCEIALGQRARRAAQASLLKYVYDRIQELESEQSGAGGAGP